MKTFAAPKGDGSSCCRRKDLMGKKLKMKDGVYVLNKGKNTEHIISVKNGYVHGGDSPAIYYPKDCHTEYWTEGFPNDRSDGSPAIVSSFGLLTESWRLRECVLINKYHQEMEIT